MTDSILRSYQAYSFTSIVPFPAVPREAGALGLLTGEDDGFAVDATTSPATVSVRDTGTPGNDLSNVGLDAANLTNSSTSAKMVHHVSSPYVRWSPHNLFLNSASPATQNVTLVTGYVYTYGITGTGSLAGTSGASGTATSGSPVTFTATGTTGTFTVTGSPTTMWINRGVTQTPYLATTGTIRIGNPHNYDATAAKYGMLIEPAATNLCVQSEDWGTTWGNQNITLSTNNIAAPDTATTADKFDEGSSAGKHNFYNTVTASASVVQAISVYAKAGTGSFAQLSWTDTANSVCAVFNLAGGTSASQTDVQGTGSLTSTSQVDIGGGWYRLSIIASVSTANPFITVGLAAAATGNSFANGQTTYTGTNKYAYFWGAQVETGVFVSSYTPTLGSSVPRAVDSIVINPLTTFPFSQIKGTIYTDCTYSGEVAIDKHMYDLTTSTWVNRHRLHIYSNDDTLIDNFDGTNTGVGNLTCTDSNGDGPNARYQCSAAWAQNDFDGTTQGGALQTDASGDIPSDRAFWYIGRTGFGSGENSNPVTIFRLVYVPRQVQTEDANLQTWRYNF